MEKVVDHTCQPPNWVSLAFLNCFFVKQLELFHKKTTELLGVLQYTCIDLYYIKRMKYRYCAD